MFSVSVSLASVKLAIVTAVVILGWFVVDPMLTLSPLAGGPAFPEPLQVDQLPLVAQAVLDVPVHTQEASDAICH